LYYCIFHSRIQ